MSDTPVTTPFSPSADSSADSSAAPPAPPRAMSPDVPPIVLRLKKREERRVLAGHLWVFSNEIDTAATPLKGLAPGAAVILESSTGRFLAHAQANPASLIAARIVSRTRNRPFDATALGARLADALALRERRYPEPFYRWVFGEGDRLPGLVVDRYGPIAVVQITTAGMEVWKDDIVARLVELGGLEAVYLRNDTPARELEHLPAYRSWAHGDAVETLEVRENGLRYALPAESSQKTGWFYDHRDNRAAIASWCADLSVLDVYTYLGGFALNAAAAGAKDVLAIDSSGPAILAARENARINELEATVEFREDDAVEAMRGLVEQGRRFDVVVLDPPAFVKRKKDREAGMRHYALNNKLALKLLGPGGLLLSASCSQALDTAGLVDVVRQSVPKEADGLQLLSPIAQAPDHPVMPAMPETSYLGGGIFRRT